MAKLAIVAGATSQTVNVFIQDSSSTVGAGLTGLVYNTSNLVAYYGLPRAAAVAITLATQTVTGAWSSGGFVEISSTNMPGWYRLDVPDAAIASGRFSSIHLKGATNMAPCPLEIELTGWNNQDAVHGGMSALPNTACTTNASLLTSGTGTDQVSVSFGRAKADTVYWNAAAVSVPTNAGVPNVNAKTWNDLATVELPLVPTTAGRKLDVTTTGGAGIDWSNVEAPTTTLALTGTTIAVTQKVDIETIKTNPVVNGGTVTFASNTTVANTTGAVGSVTGAVGSVTGAVGSVTGAVGSVTGAVGSVTGNVGGNVTGSVGSVVGAVGSVTADVGITQAAADKVFGASGAAMAELTGVPSGTPSPRNALMLIFMALRNKLTTTATAKTIYNDAGAAIAAKALSDDATTYTEDELA